MTRSHVEDAVLAVVHEKARLREIHGYGPVSVAYYADLDSGISTEISGAAIRRAVYRLKRRGVIKYQNRVGWVPVAEDKSNG